MDSRAFINRYLYFGLIVILSLFMLFFLPFVGTELGMAWVFPNTFAGWVIWIVSNLCSALLNGLLFHFFIKQGKINIKDNPDYLAANELLGEYGPEDCDIPRSPRQYHQGVYGKKGASLIVFSVLGAISFSSAFLAFNAMKFLAQLFTLIMGLVFGFSSMKSEEEFWTSEYPRYARKRVKEIQEEKTKQHKEATEQCIPLTTDNS